MPLPVALRALSGTVTTVVGSDSASNTTCCAELLTRVKPRTTCSRPSYSTVSPIFKFTAADVSGPKRYVQTAKEKVTFCGRRSLLSRVQEVNPWTTTRHETPRKLASRPHEWRATGPEGVGF